MAANENVLDGLRCPNCGSNEPLRIQVVITGLLTVTDDGYNLYDLDIDGTEWEDTSFCACYTCNHEGTVADFKIAVTA